MILVPSGVAALAITGLAVHGAFHRNSSVFGRVITQLPYGEKSVSLTFDDGPNPEATPRILDTLAEAGVHATFFCLGRHVERWPTLVERAREEGHQVANHGYFHRKLHLKSPSYVRDDLTRGKRAIEDAGGGTPRFFRAPHGFRSPWVTSIARSLGEQTVGWSLGVWDSACPGVENIVQRTIQGTRPRSIILLHDGDGYNSAGDRRQTAEALPQIIMQLKDRGYKFRTLPT